MAKVKRVWVVYGSPDVQGVPYRVYKTEQAARDYIKKETDEFFKNTRVNLQLRLLSTDYYKE